MTTPYSISGKIQPGIKTMPFMDVMAIPIFRHTLATGIWLQNAQ